MTAGQLSTVNKLKVSALTCVASLSAVVYFPVFPRNNVVNHIQQSYSHFVRRDLSGNQMQRLLSLLVRMSMARLETALSLQTKDEAGAN
jgi:hypothetical protein